MTCARPRSHISAFYSRFRLLLTRPTPSVTRRGARVATMATDATPRKSMPSALTFDLHAKCSVSLLFQSPLGGTFF